MRGPLPSTNPLEAWRKPPASGLRATWLGHSTVLIEIDGLRVLTDPVWGPRASPSRLAGPKRFQPVPVVCLLLVLFLAAYFAERWEFLRELRESRGAAAALERLPNTLRPHLPRLLHVPEAPKPGRPPRTFAQFQGLLPRTTFAIVVTLAASGLGTVLMARIAGVPILPMACAADRAWYLDRWDRFMIPKPFATVCVGVGPPHPVPRSVPLDDIERHRAAVQEAVMSVMRECEHAVRSH